MSIPGIYIGSTCSYAGKNTLNIGLGLRFQKDGLKIGYMKPVGQLYKEVNGHVGDEDAFYVQDVLDLAFPPELVTPLLATQDFRSLVYDGQIKNNRESLDKIKKAYTNLSQGRDLMLVGGSGTMISGRYCGLSPMNMVNELGLKAIVIDRLNNDIAYDTLLSYKDSLGDRMIGTVLNAVPQTFMNEVESVTVPFLERNGIKVLGVLPNDPLLGAINVESLAEGLGGRTVAAAGNFSERMVESFLIGTMQVENFMTYFRRMSNAAVIVGGDRADVELVAIEGNCACLILTGNLYPNDIILARAEALNVPIIMVRDDTYNVAKKMDRLLGRHKLRDISKIRQAAHITNANIDFDTIRQALGLN